MLILVGKVEVLLDMLETKKRLFDLGSGHQVLCLKSVTNGLSTDSDVGNGLKLMLELDSSISFANGDKLH